MTVLQRPLFVAPSTGPHCLRLDPRNIFFGEQSPSVSVFSTRILKKASLNPAEESRPAYSSFLTGLRGIEIGFPFDHFRHVPNLRSPYNGDISVCISIGQTNYTRANRKSTNLTKR